MGFPAWGLEFSSWGCKLYIDTLPHRCTARSWDATPAIVAKYALFSGPILSHKVESQPQSASDQCENEHKI